MMAHRDHELHRCTFLVRDDFQRSTQAFGSRAHTRKSMSVALTPKIKPATVVGYFQKQSVCLNSKLNLGFRAFRMPNRVVDRFLEDQEEFTANVRAHSNFALRVGKPKPTINGPGRENITGKVTHALGKI